MAAAHRKRHNPAPSTACCSRPGRTRRRGEGLKDGAWSLTARRGPHVDRRALENPRPRRARQTCLRALARSTTPLGRAAYSARGDRAAAARGRGGQGGEGKGGTRRSHLRREGAAIVRLLLGVGARRRSPSSPLHASSSDGAVPATRSRRPAPSPGAHEVRCSGERRPPFPVGKVDGREATVRLLLEAGADKEAKGITAARARLGTGERQRRSSRCSRTPRPRPGSPTSPSRPPARRRRTRRSRPTSRCSRQTRRGPRRWMRSSRPCSRSRQR